MKKKNIFVTRQIPEIGLRLLTQSGARVDVNPEDRALTRKELLKGVQGRDAVLCLLTDRIDDEVMAAAGPQCQIFSNCAVGYNNIDLEAAQRRGLRITNTPGVLTDATADFTWALLFAAARRVVESDAFMRTGQWQGWGPLQFLGTNVSGATLGIVGAGRIGENVALKSIGFGMRVLYTHPRKNFVLEKSLRAARVDLDVLLAQSDFISLHVPLTEKTRHLISSREFGLMKPHAILINTARGPVVDENALVKALRENRIAGAALDVYENEPVTAPGLLDLPNVVACPHLASATKEARSRMADIAARNLLAVLNGNEPLHAVV